MEEHVIPAAHGHALRLAKGDAVTVVNDAGTQVVDTWAFCAEDPSHAMSMSHSRVELGRISAREGGTYVTDRREPILRVERDTSPGLHDTLFAACDPPRYANLGCTEPHRSCAENLREALDALGVPFSRVPQPLNLFMNIPVGADLTLENGAPLGKPGDLVTLRALRDCIVAFSSCPQDLTPINGGKVTAVTLRIERQTSA